MISYMVKKKESGLLGYDTVITQAHRQGLQVDRKDGKPTVGNTVQEPAQKCW
jgi:hypothetical protein